MVRVALALLLMSIAPGAFASAQVSVPAGQLRPFWIESRSESGGRVVTERIPVKAFRADVRAVTNAEFAAFLRKHPRWQKARVSPLFADESYLSQFNAEVLKAGARPDAPVSFVPWFAAKAFCESRGQRLPTTHEWEYMAAASEDRPDASGDPRFLARILEWYSQPRSGEWLGAAPGRKNFYGIADLHGWIWEWVDDFNSNFVTGESREDSSFDRNMFCGAGGLSGGDKENYAAFMRFAFRSSLNGRSAIWNLGFRCVEELKP
ncbi:MAG: formylglycine-generating enzyme family protein [Bdellovibrionaceae bacterium]|nr:formylglycine-generating enzyme family protein [Pseudobdellovibrionaceae bacterium]